MREARNTIFMLLDFEVMEEFEFHTALGTVEELNSSHTYLHTCPFRHHHLSQFLTGIGATGTEATGTGVRVVRRRACALAVRPAPMQHPSMCVDAAAPGGGGGERGTACMCLFSVKACAAHNACSCPALFAGLNVCSAVHCALVGVALLSLMLRVSPARAYSFERVYGG